MRDKEDKGRFAAFSVFSALSAFSAFSPFSFFCDLGAFGLLWMAECSARMSRSFVCEYGTPDIVCTKHAFKFQDLMQYYAWYLVDISSEPVCSRRHYHGPQNHYVNNSHGDNSCNCNCNLATKIILETIISVIVIDALSMGNRGTS